MKKYNIVPTIIFSVIGTIIIVLLVILLMKPSILQKNIDTDVLNYLQNPPNDKLTCQISFSKTTINAGEEITGTIQDGSDRTCIIYAKRDSGNWAVYAVVKTDSTGRYEEKRVAGSDGGTYYFRAICGDVNNEFCITDLKTVKINPFTCDSICQGQGYESGYSVGQLDACNGIDKKFEVTMDTTKAWCCCDVHSSWNIGDVVDTEESQGTLTGSGKEWEIDLGDVQVGGEDILGVKIERQWSYVDQSKCYGIQGTMPVGWYFYDSAFLKWTKTDIVPTNNFGNPIEICGMTYDGTKWRFGVDMPELPECQINYKWRLRTFVCDKDN